MIKRLTGKYQKHVAVFLFLIFYAELVGGMYTANSLVPEQTSTTIVNPGIYFFNDQLRKKLLINAPAYSEIKTAGNDETAASVSKINKQKNTNYIGGPGQPEMSTFKSVGADNMVNLFTGDFSYNIHLLDVGGYPVNIFYSAGATMDQEASWVGLGWNINPGTISRNMRGLPDDYNGVDSIAKVQSIKHDLTIGVTGTKGLEIVGVPGLSAEASVGIFYNNRRGLGLEAGVKGDYNAMKFISKKTTDEKTTKDTTGYLTTKTSAGINLNSQNGMTLNAGFDITKYKFENASRFGLGTSLNYDSRQGLTDLRIEGESSWYDKQLSKLGDLGEMFSNRPGYTISFARSSFIPSIRMPITRFNQSYAVKLGKEKKVFFKNAVINGYIQESRIDKVDTFQKKPAYGYMYYEQGNSDKNAMLDFNRLNDGVYTYKTPVISVPVYTYDVFSINGEGTGGSFRGFRGNMGYVRDNDTKTKNGNLSISFDLGGGDILHGGVVLGGVYSPSFVNEWKFGNTLRKSAAFNTTDSVYQSFYFKNPGEKAIIDRDYYSRMGADSLIRPYLGNTQSATPFLRSAFQVMNSERKVERTISLAAGNNTSRNSRDKRTQVITYLTALDADRVGLDKYIYSYTENLFQPGSCSNPIVRTPISRYNPNDPTFYRKAHHLSEVDVLESDGRRYVYGIPVYQIMQKEVTFTTDNTPTSNQLVSYTPGDENSTNNNDGRDGFYQSETMKGYAHSFLLTGILSPDYVDVTNDGISDDDLGTAIKFNYSRVNKQRSILFGANFWRNYKWRMPADENKANFNEGLKADSRDNKGLYTYGEKELWYLHSIESKNMVATFYVSDRNDGRQVLGENGGISSGPGQKKLDKINLYTKADYLKYGSNAKPVKTVHFRYSYKLCKGFNLNNSGQSEDGKLTLDSLWFTYNGNNNQARNKYRFKYAQTITITDPTNETINVNPDYNPVENDRWGNYKPHAKNPNNGVGNNDYPYTLQETQRSNAYAAAWNLERILLPGGAVVRVQYEADDYAFVQDKRACQMTQVAGFGKFANSTPSNKLYTYDPLLTATPAQMDHRFVFFNVAQPLTNKADVREKYLKDFKQLLLKLWVLMPKGNIGNTAAYEPVIIYGVIKDYNVVTGNPNRFYIELEETKKGGSPIMETVMQFLKDQLPQRAYPGYEVNGDGALVQVVRSVMGMVNAFTQGVLGFERDLKMLGKCKEVFLNMSFARLNNPMFKKIGGGHRVKKVTINDNWSTMTHQFESVYGQEYNYTTTEEVNGQKINISSGVASYEPGVGNEENPFREVLKYSEKQFLGPTSHENVELPFAETFFPAPMVGYSKVTVKSIHNKDNKNIKSGIGLQQTEFYTTRDFPVISEYTDFDNDSRHHHKPGVIERIFNFNKRDYMTLTQGFRIVLNDMNGKMKSQTSFAENDLVNPINYTANFYRLIPRGDRKFRLDNTVPVISAPDGMITDKIIGKDIEVMNDFREHFSYTYAANIPLNVELFRVGTFPIIIPTIFRLMFRNESMYRSATTLKIVNEYGILDSVVNIDKGSVVGTKNLVYDAESGDVLVSRTNNEFKKPVYQFSYPAWWAQTGMEPAYRNIDLTYKGVFFRNGRIENNPNVNMDRFESGDEIYVIPGNGIVNESEACIGLGYPATLPVSNEYRIWALDIRKDLRNTEKEFIFIDRYGNPYNANNVTLRVIRSGKRNLTGASVGSIVSLTNPIRTVGNQQQIVIDNNTDVINTSAAEFKERWRTNDLFYSADTILRTIRQAPILPTTVYRDSTQSFGEYYTRGTRYYDNIPNPTYYMTEYYNTNAFIGPGKDFRQKSWTRFDFPSATFNAGTQIYSAKLLLQGHKVNHAITINKNENPGAPIYTVDNHGGNNPHVSTNKHKNDFLITRMFSQWPNGNNFSAWKTLYNFYPPITDFNAKSVTGTAPPISYADFNIDVTRLVQGMLKDKFDPQKNYSTALRINLIKEDGGNLDPARVCFMGQNGGVKYMQQAPRIEVQYYNCDNSNPIVYQGSTTGAPTVPPEGYAYCVSDELVKLCFSVFTKKQMNPYVEGVLGNWRGWRSYVYYGERRESDPTVATDIRKDGVIKDYESYWTFNPTLLDKTGSTKWVWNAEITQYNRKGAELENHDPLGRYNSGLYGYQESLPVAVINNSRLRLSAFDGFEDYFYKDDPCEPYCKPSKRHFTTGISTTQLDTIEAHSGKYSFKVNANTNYQVNVKVSDDDEVYNPDMRIKLNKTPYQSTVIVTPKGIGLKGYYYNNTTLTAPHQNTREDAYVSFVIRSKNNNACKNDSDPMPAGVNCGNISVKWVGKVQVITSGVYEFASSWTNDACKIYINNVLKYEATLAGSAYNQNIIPVNLTAGTLYDIRVEYVQFGGVGEINMVWKKPGAASFTTIDPKHLYPEGKEYLANGTTITQTIYCEKPDTIQAINHHLIDSFNLIPGKKMVASVWVKKGGQDCKCTSYNNIAFSIRNESGGVIASFAPKERIIEGWQQFEAIFTVPANNNQVKLYFQAPSDVPVYLDDLRLHPFNANMKSFVYDPVTLRLAAELDENNYASFYEYDDEGGLIRVKKETKEGIKTITETRSSIQRKITEF